MSSGAAFRTSRRGLVLVGLAILLGAPLVAQRSSRSPLKWPSASRTPAPGVLPGGAVPASLVDLVTRAKRSAWPLTNPPIATGTSSTIDETEPNNSLGLAEAVAFGDTVNGTISPAFDMDFFAVDLTAGMLLDFHVVPTAGSALSPYIALISADSLLLGEDTAFGGTETRIVYQVPSTGRYLLEVRDYYFGGGTSYGYRLSTGNFEVGEVEPNNTAAQATLVVLGDTVSAGAGPGDVDFFAVDLEARTYLGVEYVPLAEHLELELRVLASDGATVLLGDTVDIINPSSVRYYATAAGRYYVATRALYNTSGFYGVHLVPLPAGPGDPLTVIVENLGIPGLAVAGLSGDVYAFNIVGFRLLHVSAAGDVTVLPSGSYVTALAVDGFGYLLAAASGSILRFGPKGIGSPFVTDAPNVSALAVAPDGDVWAMGCSNAICPFLWHYSATGVLKDSSRISGISVSGSSMAYSPSGVLHVIGWDGVVYRMTENGLTVAVSDSNTVFRSLAFDKDGYLYLADEYQGIRLYDPTYNVVEAPFAGMILGAPLSLMFLRDASQAMTARLVIANGDQVGWTPYQGALLEANPGSVRAQGYPPQPRLLRIAEAPHSPGQVGAPYLDTLQLVDPPTTVRWAVTDGTLPNGITLDSLSGVLSGVPDHHGTFRFSVRGTSGDRLGPGTFTIVIYEPNLMVADIVNAILGVSDLLTEDEQRFLDLQGNQNGQLDVGDVRAYLAARRQLPGLDVSALRPKGER